jgi:hypothetical protein
MKLSTLSSFGLFGTCLIIGGIASWAMWSEAVYVGSDSPRGPANIPRSYDFSALKGSDYIQASSNRLLADFEIMREADRVGIRLGHFATRGPTGKKQFACDVYDRVELTFLADGVADSGERPKMTIESKCQVAADVNLMKPIWIPYKRILGEPVGNIRVQYLDEDVEVSFDSVTGSWPNNWVLENLKIFSSSNPEYKIDVDARHVNATLLQPLSMDWKADEERLPSSQPPEAVPAH